MGTVQWVIKPSSLLSKELTSLGEEMISVGIPAWGTSMESIKLNLKLRGRRMGQVERKWPAWPQ